MYNLDVKERKILYQLDIDSRQSFRSIGRKVGLSKDVVSSRVKKLQKNGVIWQFYPIINPMRMGYTWLRLYFVFQYTTLKVRKQIIDYFVKQKIVSIVVRTEGQFDVVVFIAVRKLSDFFSFYYETLNKYRDNFSDIIFTIYTDEHRYKRSFLIGVIDEAREKPRFKPSGFIETDELDFEILKCLGEDARMPISHSAQRVGSTATTITTRLKRLTKSGVIEGFSVLIDHSTIGYQWYKIDIELKEYEKRPQIIKYLEKNPYLIAIDKTIGFTDLELEFCFRDINHLHEVMENLVDRFPDAIKKYFYTAALEAYKFLYMPEQ